MNRDSYNQWRKKDRDKDPEKYRKYNRDYYHRNKDRCNWNWKKYWYGITEEEFNALLGKQNNICPICGNELSGRVTIDHDHYYKENTGKVLIRGILHDSCNRWVGWVETHIRLLKPTLNYLRRTNEQKEKRSTN